jgi:putative ABC transport system ATP-binding protein
LTKRFPSGESTITVLENVDLMITSGEAIAVVGPSGSGKSSLLALVAGLDRPSSGQVLVGGREIQDLSEDDLAILRRKSIGFVFQSFQLLGNLTAKENVMLPLELAEEGGASQRADKLLADVQLSGRGHHYPSQLSGGEQQRVALARAFATSPSILLADEPTGTLDRATGAMVLEMLRKLRAESRTTLVLVTHDEAVAAIADRVVHLRDGRLEATTPGGNAMTGTGHSTTGHPTIGHATSDRPRGGGG